MPQPEVFGLTGGPGQLPCPSAIPVNAGAALLYYTDFEAEVVQTLDKHHGKKPAQSPKLISSPHGSLWN